MRIDIHPDDQEEIDGLIRDIKGWRSFLAKPGRVLAYEAGVPEAWMRKIEQGDHGQLKLPTICKVAHVFRCVVDVTLNDVEAGETPEIASLSALAKAQPQNGSWLESLAMAVLKQARVQLDIPAQMMAAKLGMRVDKFEFWEREADAVLVPHLMSYARELGGMMLVRLARVK